MKSVGLGKQPDLVTSMSVPDIYIHRKIVFLVSFKMAVFLSKAESWNCRGSLSPKGTSFLSILSFPLSATESILWKLSPKIHLRWRYFILLWHITDLKCVLPHLKKREDNFSTSSQLFCQHLGLYTPALLCYSKLGDLYWHSKCSSLVTLDIDSWIIYHRKHGAKCTTCTQSSGWRTLLSHTMLPGFWDL